MACQILLYRLFNVPKLLHLWRTIALVLLSDCRPGHYRTRAKSLSSYREVPNLAITICLIAALSEGVGQTSAGRPCATAACSSPPHSSWFTRTPPCQWFTKSHTGPSISPPCCGHEPVLWLLEDVGLDRMMQPCITEHIDRLDFSYLVTPREHWTALRCISS